MVTTLSKQGTRTATGNAVEKGKGRSSSLAPLGHIKDQLEGLRRNISVSNVLTSDLRVVRIPTAIVTINDL